MKRAVRLTDLVGGSALVAAVLFAPTLVSAEGGGAVQRGDWVFTLGLGAGVAPDYEGSEDYEPIPFATVRAQYQEYYAQLRGPNLKVNVVPSKLINFGPVIKYNGGRDDVENNRVDRLPDVDESLEVGAFFGVNFRNWNIDIEGVQDVAGGHGGYLFEFGVGHTFMLAEGLSWNLGLDWSYASEDYMDEFFGIGPVGAARSGLPRFSASDGFKDFGTTSVLNYRITESWGATAIFSYSRLIEDAADSPVTDIEGSPNQFFGGIIGSYSF